MIYRKRGSVARWENGTLVRVRESGMAREEGVLFECRPDAFPLHGVNEEPDERLITATAKEITGCADVAVERLLVTHGVAQHLYGEKRWGDSIRRVHVSLVKGRIRALLDLAAFDVDAVLRLADLLARAEEQERPSPRRIRIAPNVAAALLPAILNTPVANTRVVQTAGGTDGRGDRIVEATSGWPNWYRPSYRVRPVRMPHDLRLECPSAEIDRGLPIAVALLGPVDLEALPVLVDDGGRPFPATVRIAAVEAVAREREWYPYGAGSFGAEMML